MHILKSESFIGSGKREESIPKHWQLAGATKVYQVQYQNHVEIEYIIAEVVSGEAQRTAPS
jgi:hypothetical protein